MNVFTVFGDLCRGIHHCSNCVGRQATASHEQSSMTATLRQYIILLQSLFCAFACPTLHCCFTTSLAKYSGCRSIFKPVARSVQCSVSSSLALTSKRVVSTDCRLMHMYIAGTNISYEQKHNV